MNSTEYAKGYQDGLKDIAHKLVALSTPGVLEWLEDNLVACPVREDIVRLRRFLREG